MERKYSVGLDTNSISLKVNTGTTATCYTKAYQRLSGGQKVDKAESTATTNGNISKTNVGLASELKNSELFILTIADFSALPADQINSIMTDAHTLKVNLKVEYLFDGGFSGIQNFDYDYDDYTIISSLNQVIITKGVNFIP